MASIYAHPESRVLRVAFWYDGHQYRYLHVIPQDKQDTANSIPFEV